MLLSLEHVSKQFGALTVIDDLSFEVEGGEVFGIAGPNGAGKTTLFNVITGFYPARGTISFEDRRIDRLGPHQICHRGIARTFQMPFLFESMDIYHNVAVGAHFGGERAGSDQAQIEEVLELLGLKGKENRASAGLRIFEKKLTMLAAALATRPKLLLLDEPVAGLSPIEAEQFIQLARRINRELGITIIVIEHLMRVLVEITERLLILDNGRKIALGPPKEVVKDPRVIEVYLGAEDA
jgi:branched-chain amino acid transport system ATP-binding protein